MLGFAQVPASWRRVRRALTVVCLCTLASVAQAQDAADNVPLDPPSRVARLSYLAGDLSMLPAGASDWSEASINRPLTSGDRLSTGQDARAELELGGSTLHVDGQTDVGLLELSNALAQIELTQGTIHLAIRSLDVGDSVEIDTPTVALVIDRPGSFRVDVDDQDGATRVTVFDGEAIAYGENDAQRTLHAGRRYGFDDASLAVVTINDIGGGDAFDAWSRDRDQRYAASTSRQYVSDEVVGYQDLDQYGDWHDSNDYGAVWYPRHVDVDWAPYRNGHWAYIAPWGWSWVDASPWGFAPYHYGRWAFTQRGWGWIPGPRYARAVYAPALVAFIGGSGWSIGVSSAPVGWFPLGPGEIYNPWYHASRRYYGAVNISNIRHHHRGDRHDIDRHINTQYGHYRNGHVSDDTHYVNRRAPRGITAVSSHAFGHSWAEQRRRIRLDPHKLTDAPVLVGGADLPPPVRAATRAARHTPAPGRERHVVARHAPALRRDSANHLDHRFADSADLDRTRPHVRVLNRTENHRQEVAARLTHPGKQSSDRHAAATLPSVPHFERATTLEQPTTTSVARDDYALRSGAAASAHRSAPRVRSESITDIRRQARRRDAALASSRFVHRPHRAIDAQSPRQTDGQQARTIERTRTAPRPVRATPALPQPPRFQRAAPVSRSARSRETRERSYRDIRGDIRARSDAARAQRTVPTQPAYTAPRPRPAVQRSASARASQPAPTRARATQRVTPPPRHRPTHSSKKYEKSSQARRRLEQP